MKLDQFAVLSFDCYGTMIDWETGIWNAVQPVFAAHGATIEKDIALELFGALEARTEHGAYKSYRTVLRTVMAAMAAHAGFTATDAETTAFADSVRDWPAFPDSAAALAALHTKYKLAVISNVDDDLFAHSERKLGITFDWVITAQQVGSYKPSLDNFRVAFERIGVPREQQLHVAQSLFHDIAPAKTLGLSTVWVNRRKGQPGGGATPPATAQPDLEVPDLATLATLAALTTPAPRAGAAAR